MTFTCAGPSPFRKFEAVDCCYYNRPQPGRLSTSLVCAKLKEGLQSATPRKIGCYSDSRKRVFKVGIWIGGSEATDMNMQRRVHIYIREETRFEMEIRVLEVQ